jgi:DNA modification methylase
MVEVGVTTQKVTDSYAAYCGDSVEVVKGLPAESVHLSIFSPPFANLYIYSDSYRDMGNTKDMAEFIEHYDYLASEIHRITIPGRLAAVHCKDLVRYKGRDGTAGIVDFPGELIRSMERAGWSYHSRVTIWKDPVIEMQRTKAHGLLYKQLRKDASHSRQGLAEYLLVFRKWSDEYEDREPVTHTKDDFPLDQWQEWASPVWSTINQTRVLNSRIARDTEDEKHICPLQLDIVERSVLMWTNPDDVVFSPFMGIGSEGVVSLKLGRRFVGIELKEEYWGHAVEFLAEVAESRQMTLFDSLTLEQGA